MAYFAIVFNVDRGLHETPDASDARKGIRGQAWRKGDLYSTGSVIDAATLPTYFDVVELDGPPAPETVWDRTTRQFMKAEAPHG